MLSILDYIIPVNHERFIISWQISKFMTGSMENNFYPNSDSINSSCTEFLSKVSTTT
jgi:hypothetical protein